MTPYLEMALNNAWANSTLYGALRGMPEAAVQADYPSFFGSIPATLDHIHAVDLYYLDALAGGGRGRGVFDREPLTDIAELAAAQASADMTFATFCKDLTEADLVRSCAIERRGGMTHERVDRTILHLVQHQVHHRGQVHAMISQSGHPPPQLDDFYLDYGRAPSAKAYWS